MIYVALFVGSTALLAGVYYVSSIWLPQSRIEGQVTREFEQLAGIEAEGGRAALVAALERRAATTGSGKAFHAAIAPDGHVIATNLPSWPRRSREGWLQIEADISVGGDEVDYEALTLDRLLPGGTRLIVGRDIEAIHTEREQLSAAAAWVVGLSLVLGIGGGVLMSLAIGRRIDTVNRAAQRVIGGDLSGRIDLRGTGDDFDRLGETLNLMLGRIEDLVESIRRVSDNVAHELRTPLARLRADLESLEAAGGTACGRGFDQAIAEATRLETIFEAVLRIARVESRRHVGSAGRVDLARLVEDAAEFFAPSAEEKGIALTVEAQPDLVVTGDADLLFQAVCNVLDNALKFTPSGGRVTAAARAAQGLAIVAIADDGPGVRAAEREYLTERFYRCERTSAAAGAGLGLSFVAAVADHHRGALAFWDNAPGLVVTLTLPFASPETADSGG